MKHEDIALLKGRGFILCEAPIRFLIGLAIPRVRVGDGYYCPVWVEALYREHAEDMGKLHAALLGASLKQEEQVLIASEMLLGKRWDSVRPAVSAFLESVRKGST